VWRRRVTCGPAGHFVAAAADRQSETASHIGAFPRWEAFSERRWPAGPLDRLERRPFRAPERFLPFLIS